MVNVNTSRRAFEQRMAVGSPVVADGNAAADSRTRRGGSGRLAPRSAESQPKKNAARLSIQRRVVRRSGTPTE
jgi:hypothetical protein